MTHPRRLLEQLSPEDRRVIGSALDLAAGCWAADCPQAQALARRLADPRTADGRRLRLLLAALSPAPAGREHS
jgi:hypothetical protein